MKIKSMGIYYVDRRYGGPEEGGWWYNFYDFDSTVTWDDECPIERRIAQELIAEHTGEAYGDIYSMRGGIEVCVIAERTPGMHRTTHRPYYE